jgi:hypothetical protein
LKGGARKNKDHQVFRRESGFHFSESKAEIYGDSLGFNFSFTISEGLKRLMKQSEYIDIQIYRLANRCKSFTNWFENCPVRATIFTEFSSNPLPERVFL